MDIIYCNTKFSSELKKYFGRKIFERLSRSNLYTESNLRSPWLFTNGLLYLLSSFKGEDDIKEEAGKFWSKQ